jgi:hypothetical protein
MCLRRFTAASIVRRARRAQIGAQEFETDSLGAGEIRIGHARGRVSSVVLPLVGPGRE